MKTTRVQIARAEIVSFDVFDTLILRAIARPTDAFALVKMRLLTADAALNNPRTIDAFPELRVNAELRARDAKARDGSPHCEVTLTEIYDAFASLSGADAALLEQLKWTELSVERDLVYPNPIAKELFEFARAQRKTIVLCSDMYLPSEEVATLLRRCGYAGYDALYVSCEHACSKHAGTMFPYVADRHGVPTARILHVGDNPYGDCMMAREAGCVAVHLPRPATTDRLRIPWNGEQSFYSNTVSAIVEGLWRKREDEYDPAQPLGDAWEEVGYRVFGPLFTGFLLWLAARFRERSPEKVFFLARDTHFIHQHLRAFLGDLPDEFAAEYLYVSRGSLLMPSLTDFPLSRLDHFFSGRSRSSVRRHLRRLGLLPDLFLNVAQSAGFTDLDELVPNGDPRMRVLLGKLHHELLRIAGKKRPLARRYLAQHIGDAKRVMLIDVGWVGNTQASIIRLLGKEHAEVEIAGHYIGMFPSAVDNACPGHTMHSWLTRRDDRPEIEQVLWWAGGVEILEFAMTAPHGTTLGYEEDANGEVVAIIETSDVEHAVAQLAGRVQKGAADFISEFISAYGSISADALNSRAWAAEFFRLVTDPTAEEAALLGDITHGDVAGDTSIRSPLAPKVGMLDDVKGRLSPYYWRAGFIVRNDLECGEGFSESAYLEFYPDVRKAVEDGDYVSGREHWLLHGEGEKRVDSWAAWMRKARGSSIRT